MTKRTLAAALPLLTGLALVLALAAPIAAQSDVGRVVDAEGQVRGTLPGGAAADLRTGDGLVLDHRVETGRASAAEMLIDPEGELSIGESTRLTIDRATIDRATGRGESTLSLLLGKIQLALGSLFRGEVTIETPSASLGIKGTVLRVRVDASGRTLVSVLEGVVEVTSKDPAPIETVILEAGYFTIVEPGRPPAPPAPFEPGAGTLSPSAGGPDFEVPGEDVFDGSPLLPDFQRELPREPSDDLSNRVDPPPNGPTGP